MATWIAPKTFVAADYLAFAELNAAMGPLGGLQWLKDAFASIGITADSGQQTVDSALIGARVIGTEQQIPDSEWTEIVWSQQRWGRMEGRDQPFLFSNYPSRLHLSTKSTNPILGHTGFLGHYLVGAHITWAGDTTGVRGVRLRRYRSDVGLDSKTTLASKISEATGAGAAMSMSISTIAEMFGGWGLVCEVYQDSGDVLSLQSMGATPELWIAKVGA